MLRRIVLAASLLLAGCGAPDDRGAISLDHLQVAELSQACADAGYGATVWYEDHRAVDVSCTLDDPNDARIADAIEASKTKSVILRRVVPGDNRKIEEFLSVERAAAASEKKVKHEKR